MSRWSTVLGNTLMGVGAAAALGAIVFGMTTQGGESAEGHATASPSPTASASATDEPAVASPDEFVSRDGSDLMLEGKPYKYASANAYTLMFESPAGVDVHMKIAQEMGLGALRAWAFLDIGNEDGSNGVEINNRGIYFQYFDPATGHPAYNDGETGLEHLDYVLASAREHGIKLILPFVNNWTAFGGIDQYVRWADGQYHDDFFTDETIKGWYKDWVEHVLNRTNTITGVKYKDDPTILAWELGNELRCSDSGPYPFSDACGSDIMVAWASEMSDYVRSIDEHHLIAWGGEGFLCTEPGGANWLTNCSQSADPVKLLALPNIDIHGIHVYPNHWAPTEDPSGWKEWAEGWIDEQGRIAADAGKPYYMGEYGWTDQSTRMLVFDDWLQHFYDAGGDGSHFWVMQPASSIGAPPDSVGFTQRCPGPACTLVADWSAHVGQDKPWTDFGPIAENDFAFVDGTAPARIDVLANDKAFQPAIFDAATIDLDPETSGVQTEAVRDAGTFSVVDGFVIFTPAGDGGSAKASYVVSDSEGRTTQAVTVAVAPRS